MPALQRRAVQRALGGKLGGEKQPNKRHETYRFTLPSGSWRMTWFSRGSAKEIPAWTVSNMARQLGLPTKEFQEAVNCTLSKDDFWALLKLREALDGP